jgi:hypothetical protein
MNTSNEITGLWHSYYEYGKGAADGMLSSEHDVQFVREQDRWVGTSLPNEEGSRVTFELASLDNEEFRGSWVEHTSPAGHYKGREFSGLIMFLLNAEGTELNGMWLGAGSSSQRVKAGKWMLSRRVHE